MTQAIPEYQKLRWRLALVALLLLTTEGKGVAQVIPDATLGGERSTINSVSIVSDRIDGGARRGLNLFHSFSQFDIQAGHQVYFNNPAGVTSIFSRVTGSQPSNINGILGVSGNANLFFINPNGITFGPNAELQLGGSFIASTANSFVFPNGGQFSATNPTVPQLLAVDIQAPIGLQFEGPGNPIHIKKASLILEADKTLALIGGPIRMEGGLLQTEGGRIELGSTNEKGTVQIDENLGNFSINFPSGLKREDILLSDNAVINIRSGGDGSISVHANNLTLNQTSKLIAGLRNVPTSVGKAGDIVVNLQGNLVIDNNSAIANDLLDNIQQQSPSLINRAGDIYITAQNLSLSNESRISSGTFGKGSAGNLSLDIKNSINIDKAYILSTVHSGAIGDSGNIKISTNLLNVLGSSELHSLISSGVEGEGKAGDIVINSISKININESEIISTLNRGAVGKGGNILINTNELQISNQGLISTSTTGQGDAGNITINAHEKMNFSGKRTYILSSV